MHSVRVANSAVWQTNVGEEGNMERSLKNFYTPSSDLIWVYMGQRISEHVAPLSSFDEESHAGRCSVTHDFDSTLPKRVTFFSMALKS